MKGSEELGVWNLIEALFKTPVTPIFITPVTSYWFQELPVVQEVLSSKISWSSSVVKFYFQKNLKECKNQNDPVFYFLNSVVSLEKKKDIVDWK